LQQQYEIDPKIERLVEHDAFKTALRGALGTLPGWDDKRTDAVVGLIKHWNKTPSFPVAVKRACMLFSLPEPDKRLIATRHKLMHIGELQPGIKGMTGWEYDVELESLVLVLLLKLLGYNGVFFHAKYQSAPMNLADGLPR
jgi:hypothetical protein